MRLRLRKALSARYELVELFPEPGRTVEIGITVGPIPNRVAASRPSGVEGASGSMEMQQDVHFRERRSEPMGLRCGLSSILVLTLAGCGLGTGPADGGDETASFGSVFVLNSVGRTIGRFDLEDDQLQVAASPILLPANFDGDAMDVVREGFATTISSLGGSQVVVGNLRTSEQVVVTFPGDRAADANPGKVTFLDDPVLGLQLWVPGRGTDAIYRIDSGAEVASIVARDIGAFVERVLPFGSVLAAVDANIDDDGGTFEPLGPTRIFILGRQTGEVRFVIQLPDAVGANDAIFNQSDIFVLAGGSFSQDAGGAFAPDNNGRLVIVNATGLEVRRSFPLDANGLTLSAGGDGNVWLVRTSDPQLQRTDLLAYNIFQDRWTYPPENPLEPEDAAGAPIDCWVARGLADGRILCATFSIEPPGRLYLLDPGGRELSSIESGAGSTDIVVR